MEVRGPQRPSQFIGNTKRAPIGEQPSKLQFGPHGELTDETIRQASLTKDERARAREMKKVQDAYLQILDCMSYPVDPQGNVHDLNAIGPTKLAIAWTLALNGFRRTGKKYIKKKPVKGIGVYADAHTWVDARIPDMEEPVMAPRPDPPPTPATHRVGEMPRMPEMWHAGTKITYDDDMRPEGVT